jgi:opacity protein-like surface antigen
MDGGFPHPEGNGIFLDPSLFSHCYFLQGVVEKFLVRAQPKKRVAAGHPISHRKTEIHSKNNGLLVLTSDRVIAPDQRLGQWPELSDSRLIFLTGLLNRTIRYCHAMKNRGAMTITATAILVSALTSFLLLTSAPAAAQNFELSGHIGGQINGGVDLSTAFFHRLEVGNSMNYGATLGYLHGDHLGFEFQWNHSQADTKAEPNNGTPSVKVFSLNQNQYMGNFLFHLTPRDEKLRPFVFVGLGASSLSPDRDGVNGTTRFAFAAGAGAKYNLSKHFGLRGQFKYSPTYISSTADGYWCDPFWGGCWVTGHDHYLHEFDISGGFTLRF